MNSLIVSFSFFLFFHDTPANYMDTRSTYQEWTLELVERQVEMSGEEGNGRQRQPENSINTLTNDSFITEF